MSRYDIVAATFNKVVVDRLVDGAKKKWMDLGVAESDIHVHWVPGAVEIPLAAQHIIEKFRPRAVCTLGAVIKGGTAHFDYVCQFVTSGLTQLTLRTSIPIGFGVLTTDDLMQALDRADGKHGNKGADAAAACFEMSRWMEHVR